MFVERESMDMQPRLHLSIALLIFLFFTNDSIKKNNNITSLIKEEFLIRLGNDDKLNYVLNVQE